MALPKIEAPKYSCVLPLCGQKVDFRPFLAQEERILLMASESKDHASYLTAMEDVCAACTYGKLDIDSLASVDLEFLFLNLRMRAVGETVSVGKECSGEACKATVNFQIGFDEIKVDNLDNYKANKKIDIDGNVGIIMKAPTADDIAKIESVEMTQTEKMYAMIRYSIESIYDAEQMYKPSDYTEQELSDFIDQIPISVMQKVGKFFEEQPKITYTGSCACQKCGEMNEIKLEGMADFFT